jgi:predicted DNA-binding protein
VAKELQISIRLDSALAERFERLVGKLGGAVNRAALVRLAMEAGLPTLEERYKNLPDATPLTKATSKRRR